MLKLFTIFLLLILREFSQTRRLDNICSGKHVKRIFLGLGESGVLAAYNVTVDEETVSNITLQEGCQVEVITCSSCIISFSFRYLSLSCSCGSGFNLFFQNPCKCDYVRVVEPPYIDSSGVSFCRTVPDPGGSLRYRSKTRFIKISLFYSRSHSHAFTLDYKSEVNRQFFFGTAQYSLFNMSTKFISSPFFPSAYPRDIVVEYVLTCLRQSCQVSMNEDLDCRIHLLFTDFQLGSSSIMEFYEGDRRVGVASGSSFRPPAITTSTNSLKVRFYASGQNNLGFKAIFSFISDEIAKTMVKPATDCGGYVDNFGGTITMMNMAEGEMKLYDCVWLIKPFRNLVNFKSHLFLKVTMFLDFAGEAELLVRRGLTSESPVLEKLSYPMSRSRGFQEHVIPLKSGYYVSLRAFFGPASHFAISYASFSYNKCFVLSEFLCQNYRCISKQLTCDGFDHCGDNSDEPEACYRSWEKEPAVERWYTRTPNYYFPKIKGYSDLKIASFALLLSLVGLVCLIWGVTTLIYRAGWKSRRRQRDLQEQLHSTISEFLDGLSDEVSVEDIVVDDPPSYESPPTYEDVMRMAEARYEVGRIDNLGDACGGKFTSSHA